MSFDMPTGRSGKVLALGLALLVLGAAWAAAVRPLLDLHAERAEALSNRQAQAARMEVLLQNLPSLRQQAAAATANGPPPEAILQGTTDAVAGATLQQFVQDMATQTGVTLASTEALAAEQVYSYRLIGVRTALSAPWPALVQLLQTIERAKPAIMVDDLQLHGPRLQTERDDDPPLEASMTVLALRAGTAPGAGQ
jgi:general secretion pathway protein M